MGKLMTAFEVTPTARLAFWDLIRRTFLTIKERPMFFLGLSAMAVLPSCLLEWWGLELANEMSFSFLDTVLTGAIAYGVFNYWKKENVSIGQAISRTLRWPLFIFALISVVFCILRLMWEAWIDCLGGGLGPALAGIVPPVLIFSLLSIFFLPVVPVCVVEELGLLASLRRSLKLTYGHRGLIFLLIVGSGCLFVLPAFMLFWGFSIAIFDGIFLPVVGNHPATMSQCVFYLVYLIYLIFLEASATTISAIISWNLINAEAGINK